MATPYILHVQFLIAIALTAAANMKSEPTFGTILYQQVVKAEENKNLILSPLSIQTALTLAFTAAGGKTAEEMQRVLNLRSSVRQEVQEDALKLVSKIDDNNILTMANKIYVKNDYPIKQEFGISARKYFNSDVANIDFTIKDEAVKEINGFIAEKTNNKLKDFLDPSILKSDTKMLLINTIYMKGLWQKPFNLRDTKQRRFYINNDESVDVDTMSVKGSFMYNHINSLNATAIDMPFKDSDVSMLIILPDKRYGLKELEEQVDCIDVKGIRKLMEQSHLTVQMPKFKFESSFSLKDTLSVIGMPTMFTNAADFHDITSGKEYLKVANVIHKAMIDANEDGVEVASGTAVRFVKLTGMLGQRYMRINHPFWFAITKEDTIVFTGRYLGPENPLTRRLDNVLETTPTSTKAPNRSSKMSSPGATISLLTAFGSMFRFYFYNIH